MRNHRRLSRGENDAATERISYPSPRQFETGRSRSCSCNASTRFSRRAKESE
ncbi:hypothetical protein DPMN_067166 [Dreissena polymorpha]|uniref:Uncharacterized protein n=1 Tax=Dreissena polymorpha TaxID=45954 RepID=A0A9D3YWU0_DREPO|nr:hypothetical protein DPMN_067166 [Dreissena polymorpha]